MASALTRHDGETLKAALAEMISGAAAATCMGVTPWLPNRAPTIEIRRDGDDLVLNGSARPVESAAQAEYLLVTGRAAEGTTQVLAPRSTPGITLKPLKSLDVTRRFSEVTFKDVRLPGSALVGAFGGAGGELVRQAQVASALLVAESVGAMDAAFAMTVEWAFDRYSFGRPLASYQALKHRFADMKSWLEAAHAVSDAAAVAVSRQTADAAELVSAARAFVGRYGVELAQDCVQLHGGIGVTYEHDLHFLLRRVTLDRMLYGTPGDHRQRLAAMAVGREKAA